MRTGWEYKKIGEIMLVERGGSPRPIQKFLTDSPEGINWIKISDATASNKYIYTTREKITKEGLHKTRLVEEGDFILSNSMSFGRPYIMKTRGAIHDGWLVLKNKKNIEIDTDYLYFLLGSPYIFEQFDKLAAGSTVRNLNIGLVSSVSIPIPPLPEQQQIVTILDKAFAAIDQAKANIERNIENAKELFQSKKEFLFQSLSKECKVLSIENVCEQIFAGGDAPKDNFSKEETKEFSIPIIANAVKHNGLYGYTNQARVTKPSITVAARGSGTGHTEYRDYPFVPIVRLIVLTPDTYVINAEFLMHAIKNLIIERSGSAIPQLTVPMMKSYSIPVPNKAKQIDVVQSLNQIELVLNDYKDKLEQKLELLDELKKSILHKAFSGELTQQDGLLETLPIAAEPRMAYQTQQPGKH
ncbi:restriction endonuclease subunit S [Sunxiuqinia dokdonensis]|uniref:Type I restriction modification DNA specificity domain-containing protein n=1 Tax=Sunxiuqinia dokdonensis TaxID=1409788 RepID=A0A0L8VFQ2_9BACT|nr:restriction endonuclease subunit S [Sunxiuqinia dokdonensis]KOH47012.1 hypothetical protein NC99_01900 [Sunxiuqinia dokdonensis]